MKKVVKEKFKPLVFLLIFVFFIYLVLPVDRVPDLPDSLKSDEPGDTVEMVGVSAFYTDKKREEVIGFYKDYFSKSSFFTRKPEAQA